MRLMKPEGDQGSSGGGGGDWRASLPEDLRTAPALQSVKDLGTLAKNYVEAQSALGRSLRIPSKEAGDEDRKAFKQKVLELGKDYGVVTIPEDDADEPAFYERLGRPAEAEKYEPPEVKDEELQFDDSEVKMFKSIAHAAGLSNKQFKKVIQGMAEARLPTAREAAQEFKRGHDSLKKEWGEAYDTRSAEVGKLLETHSAPAKLREAFKNGRVDAASMKWLHGVLSAFGDEPAELQKQGKNGNGAGRITPAEAEERLAEVERRMSGMPAGSEEYKRLVERRLQLLRLANP